MYDPSKCRYSSAHKNSNYGDEYIIKKRGSNVGVETGKRMTSNIVMLKKFSSEDQAKKFLEKQSNLDPSEYEIGQLKYFTKLKSDYDEHVVVWK